MAIESLKIHPATPASEGIAMNADTMTNRTFAEIQIGEKASLTRTLKPLDIQLFATLTGDLNPTHLDETFARQHQAGQRVGHSMWAASLLSGLFGCQLPGPGSVFAIPINADYQHFNASGSETARYFAVTNSCFMMNLFHNSDYIFNSDYVFTDRFDPHTEGYFSGEGTITGRFFMTTNFVPDTHTIKLTDYSERGKGSTNMKFDLARNTMGAHISEFPVGTYKKGHRHGPGAHVIILSGQGYSVLWKDGEPTERVDWGPGSVVVPPDQWFHQHFNSGAHPARYLALRWNNWRYRFMRSQDGEGGTYTSLKLGGNQIEFEDEDPQIHRDFEAAMKAAGAKCNMPYHPGCTQK